MSSGYQIKDQNGLYFLTFQVVNWGDVFSRDSQQSDACKICSNS
jgi:hypothetical protein